MRPHHRSRCAGDLRRGASEESVDKAQEEHAVNAQEEPKVVNGDNKDKDLSNEF